MNFFSFPIRRPVTIIMLILIIGIIGGIALWRMPLEFIPKITFPNVLVVYTYEGAGPEEIERTVARTVEQTIRTVSNIKNVTSTAGEGTLLINCEFNWGTNLASASVDVREKIDLVKKYLPAEVSDPIILRIDVTQMPVMFLFVDSPNRDIAELGDIADDNISPLLERIPGVATVVVVGKRDREIQVEVDRDKLTAYGLGLDSIVNAIRYQNLDMSAGNMEIGMTRYRIQAKGEFQSIEEIQNLVIGYGISQAQAQTNQIAQLLGMANPLSPKGAISPILLKDVANVKDGLSEMEGRVLRYQLDGEHSGIGIAIMKETDANMIDVARALKNAIPKIQKTLPQDIKFGVAFDFSEFITDSLSALQRSAIEGGIFAIIVLFIFLWELTPTLIATISIPVSLFFAFACMYFSGYSLNLMTMGGMVIALGKMVDDSIVVLENAFRHIEEGEEPKRAGENATREVAIAVIAATIVAVIVFLPIAFVTGLSAQLFRPFSGTIFYALLGSLIAAFTIVPMLCSRLLRKRAPKAGKKERHPFLRIQNGYVSFLGWSLDNRGKVMVIALLVLVLTGLMMVQTTTEFIPQLVGGMYIGKLKLPQGTPFPETEKVLRRVMQKVQGQVKDFDIFFTIVGETEPPERAAMRGGSQGTNEAQVMIKMKKFAQGRTTSDEQLRQIWQEIAQENPAGEVSFGPIAGLGMTQGKPIVVKIFGDDLGILKMVANDLAEQMKKVNGLLNVTTSLEQGTSEHIFSFDKTKMLGYGVVTAQAEMALRTGLYGQLASVYRKEGKEYDIMVRLKEEQRKDLKDLENIPVLSPLGFVFTLKEVGEFQYSEGPAKIVRENSKRVVTIEADKTDRALSLIANDISKILNRYPFPEGYLWEFGGEQEQQMEAFSDLTIMFILAIVLVYMVLASLYESLVHPLTILAAIPFAFTGAIIGLYITGIPFGVTAFIGLIMLVGLVANNSILLIDFVLTYHRRGMPRRDAVIQAGRIRLRPILMTALVALIAVVPIALGRAEGLEVQQPMGIAVVGGLLSSTFLTLIIVPVLYTIFDDVAEDTKNLLQRFFHNLRERIRGPKPKNESSAPNQ